MRVRARLLSRHYRSHTKRERRREREGEERGREREEGTEGKREKTALETFCATPTLPKEKGKGGNFV